MPALTPAEQDAESALHTQIAAAEKLSQDLTEVEGHPRVGLTVPQARALRGLLVVYAGLGAP